MYRLSLAARYLRRRKVAYISVLAIAVGVMAMIVVNSVMDGFQRRIKDSIFKIDGSLKVQLGKRFSPAETKDYFSLIESELEPFGPKGTGEILGMSKRIVQPAMMVTTVRKIHFRPDVGQRQEYISLVGIDVAMERTVLPFDDLLDEVKETRNIGESLFDAKNEYRWNRRLPQDEISRAEPFVYATEDGMVSAQPGLILGSQLADFIGVEIGDPVTIVTASQPPGSSFDPHKIQTQTKRFVVTGCFESGRYEYDRRLAFCDITTLQKDILKWAGDCSEVRLKVVDPSNAKDLKKRILAANTEKRTQAIDRAKEPGAGFARIAPISVQTWEDQMRTLAQALEFERLAMWLVTAFVVIVAGVSIGGLLYMVVLEKTRDIGILQSMGASSSGIVTTFLIYGTFLGVLGTALGVWLGIVVVENLNGIIHWLEGVLDRTLFPPDIYEFGSLPSHLDTTVILTYAAFTFGWCLIVSTIPAFIAARLDPLKCLSYE
ncbi:MAG: lipoprotein-releasing system permease protein [Planctomycetota bacterium]|jgi:lipoprotein-releasing system permease protein